MKKTIIPVIFISVCIHAFSQGGQLPSKGGNSGGNNSGPKYATNGNNLSANDRFGSNNYADINIFTNGAKRGAFTKDGLFDFYGGTHTRGKAAFDSSATAFEMIAQQAHFAMLMVTNTAQVDALIVNNDAHINGLLTVGNTLTFNGSTNTISASSGTLNFGTTNISTNGTITASGVNVSGQTQFDSLEVQSRIKIGSSMTLDGWPTGNNNAIYTDATGDPTLYIQSKPSPSNFNTIINANNTGKVGIGTANPIAKLEVSTAAITGRENLLRATVDDAAGDFFELRNQTNANGQFIPSLWGHHETNTMQSLYLLGEITAGGDVGTTPVMTFDARRQTGAVQTRPLFSWESFGIPKMTMLANGNVGIGTTDPQTKLHIKTSSECSAKLRLESQLSGPINGCGPSHSTWDLNAQGNNIFTITNPSLSQPAMTFLGNGNVGIGTSNPQEKLEVNGNAVFSNKVYINTTPGNITGTHYELNVCGTIHSKEWIVETTGWCDFKLKPEHKRMTWQEKLAHIETFGYLPEMDSGLEVETNGLKVAKNLRGMIWNIEDNTMDIIDLQKENQQQKDEIKNLKDENALLKKKYEELEIRLQKIEGK